MPTPRAVDFLLGLVTVGSRHDRADRHFDNLLARSLMQSKPLIWRAARRHIPKSKRRNVLEFRSKSGAVRAARLPTMRSADRRDQQVAGRDRILARRQDPARQREFPERARLLAGGDQGPAPQHVRRSGLPPEPPSTGCSGRSSAAANSTPASTSGSARAARRSGSRRATTRSSTATARPYKVVKFATDITEQKLRNADFEGQLAAISKAQAVIEFTLDGTILTRQRELPERAGLLAATRSRASITACSSSRPIGRAPSTGLSGRSSAAANIDAAQYKRIGKGGKEIWIQASYNPILDCQRQAVQGRQVRNRHHRAGEGKRDAAIDRPADPGRRRGGQAATICPAHPAGRQDRRTCSAVRAASMVCSTPWRRS